MSRVRMFAAAIVAATLAGCGGLSGAVVPATGDGVRAPQTLRAVPITSPTPAPSKALKAPQILRAVPISSPTPAPAG